MDNKLKTYHQLIHETSLLKKENTTLEGKIKNHFDASIDEIKQAIDNGDPSFEVEKLKGIKQKERAVSNYREKIKINAQKIEEYKNKIEELKTVQSKINKFSSDHHFMLTPVKLETRFVKTQHIAKIKNSSIQFVDNYVNPSDYDQILFNNLKEKKNKYNGIIPLQNIRYHPNVNTQDQKIPLLEDQYELWIRIYPDEIHQCTHEEQLTTQELDIAKKFYSNISKASEKEVTEKELVEKEQIELMAWKRVVSQLGTARALYVLDKTKPEFIDGPPELTEPLDDGMKEKKWSKPPMAKGLPNQFVIRLYIKNSIEDYTALPLPKNEKGVPELQIGIDPSVTPFKTEGKTLDVDKNLKWLTDINEAVKVGMAIKIKIDKSTYEGGIDKIIALGYRDQNDLKKNKSEVEKLFTNHIYKPNGLTFLPIGTATNNSEKEKSGKTIEDLGIDESWKLFNPDLKLKSNGIQFLEEGTDLQRLALSLGLDSKIFKHGVNISNTEISKAVSMNRSLAFGTLGYALSLLFNDKFNGVSELRDSLQFFNYFVLGRGNLPSIRIGAQPYGFLPVTHFSNPETYDKETSNTLINHFFDLYPALWTAWEKETINLKKIIDSKEQINDQKFMGFLTNHPSTVEVFQTGWSNLNIMNPFGSRFDLTGVYYGDLVSLGSMVSWDLSSNVDETKEYYNYMNFFKTKLISILFSTVIPESNFHDIKNIAGVNTYDDKITPETPHAPLLFLLLRYTILRAHRFTNFLGNNSAQNIALLDKESIVDNRNEDKEVRNQLIKLNQQKTTVKIENQIKEFLKNPKKIASYFDELLVANKTINDDQNILKKVLNPLTGDTAVDYTKSLNNLDVTMDTPDIRLLPNYFLTKDIQSSLTNISDITGKELERLFTEHLDVLSYRADTWFTGFAYYQLLTKRKDFQFDISKEKNKQNKSPFSTTNSTIEGNEGLYYGTYGYLEDISKDKDSFVKLKEVNIDYVSNSFSGNTLNKVPVFPESVELGEAWVYLGTIPNPDVRGIRSFKLYENESTYVSKGELEYQDLVDKDNQGFIPTPSLDHAVTAAILRSGFVHQKREKSGTNGFEESEIPFATNLGSNRVRAALFYIEGLQNGQEIHRLLGYRFERMLKENDLTKHIFQFRQLFPIKYLKIDTNGEDVEESRIEEVVDGIALIKKYKEKDRNIDKFIDEVFKVEVSETPLSTTFSLIKEQIALSIDVGDREKLSNRLNKILKKILSEIDAINDLFVSEAVFQIARGNIDRAMTALKGIVDDSNEEQPENTLIKPQIQDMPRRGYSMSHKVGYVLDDIEPAFKWGKSKTPLQIISPEINDWICNLLPSPSKIIIVVKWKEHQDDLIFLKRKIQIAKIDIQPIDLVHIIQEGSKGTTNTELLFRTENYLLSLTPFKDQITIGHFFQLDEYDRENLKDDEYSVYELYSLIDTIYGVLSKGRAMVPKDFTRAIRKEGDTNKTLKEKLDTKIDVSKIRENITHLKTELNISIKEVRNFSTLIDDENDLKREDVFNIRNLFIKLAKYKISNAIPSAFIEYVSNTKLLKRYFERVLLELQSKEQSIPEDLKNINTLEEFKSIGKNIFGKNILLLPVMQNLNDIFSSQIPTANTYVDNNLNPEILDWIQSLAPVRPKMALFQRLEQLAVRNVKTGLKADIMQFPLREKPRTDRWQANHIEKEIFTDDGKRNDIESYLLSVNVDGIRGNQPVAGIIIDDWIEKIPEKTRNMGIAMHYDKNSSEAPQNILLATSSNKKRATWDWEELIGCVHDSFVLAKMRNLRPDQIPDEYRKYLPLLIAPIYADKSLGSLVLSNSIKPNDSAGANGETDSKADTIWTKIKVNTVNEEFADNLKFEIRDPAWMLSRQWQSGELNGEDKGSPIFSEINGSYSMINSVENSKDSIDMMDIKMQLELIVECAIKEPDLQTKIELGKQWIRLIQNSKMTKKKLLISKSIELYPFLLPDDSNDVQKIQNAHLLKNEKYIQLLRLAIFNKSIDGWEIVKKLQKYSLNKAFEVALGKNDLKKIFLNWYYDKYSQHPDATGAFWNATRNEYSFKLKSEAKNDKKIELTADEYYNGRLDWYACGLNFEEDVNTIELKHKIQQTVIPSQIIYPGMPVSRLWEFEDRSINFSSLHAGISQLPLIPFIQFGLVYGDDWFMMPLGNIPDGSIVDLKHIIVTDSFGVKTRVKHYTELDTTKSWSYFTLSENDIITSNKQDRLFFLPPSTIQNMESEPVESINFIRDEMANLVWGIESVIPDQIIGGVDADQIAKASKSYYKEIIHSQVKKGETLSNDATIEYKLATEVPFNWIPFLPIEMKINTNNSQQPEIMLQRGAMPRISFDDLSELIVDKVRPLSPFLTADFEKGKPVKAFRLHEEEVPRSGVFVQGSWQRARGYDGKVVLWYGYKKTTGRGEGQSGLMFDQVVPKVKK